MKKKNQLFIIVSLLILVGCFPKFLPISYVKPSAPDALVEMPIRPTQSNMATLMPKKIDGQDFWITGFRGGRISGNNEVFTWELGPGSHTFEVIVMRRKSKSKQINPFDTPLIIELNVHAGHNYRINAYVYNEVTTWLYVEDIDTGEVVAGHGPEKQGSP